MLMSGLFSVYATAHDILQLKLQGLVRPKPQNQHHNNSSHKINNSPKSTWCSDTKVIVLP